VKSQILGTDGSGRMKGDLGLFSLNDDMKNNNYNDANFHCYAMFDLPLASNSISEYNSGFSFCDIIITQ
jgi:hypothetical protein